MSSPNPYAPPRAKVVDIAEDSDDFELAGAGLFRLFAIVGAVILICFNVQYVRQNGQSIAKKWPRIKVVRSDGSPASLGPIFWLRNFVNGLFTRVFGLYFIIDSPLIFGESRQCVHDTIADPIVVVA